MKIFSFSLLILFTTLTSAHAAVVVDFNLSQITTGTIGIGTSASTTGVDTDTYTSTIGFSTTTAYISGHANYTGPDQFGGAYRQIIYSEPVSGGAAGWFELRSNLGIYGRRNGPNNPTGVTNSGESRIATLFATGGSYSFDEDSSVSILLTGVTTGNSSSYLFVENDGLLYRGTTNIIPSSSLNTLTDLHIWSFQQVTVDTTTLALTDVAAPLVVGSDLENISKIGFFIDSTGGTGPSQSITAFSADLTLVPEPSALNLLLGAAGVFLMLRRRKSSSK